MPGVVAVAIVAAAATLQGGRGVDRPRLIHRRDMDRCGRLLGNERLREREVWRKRQRRQATCSNGRDNIVITIGLTC